MLPSTNFNMADKDRLEAGPIGEKTEYGKIGEKRRSTGDDGPAAKKITMNLKSLKQDHPKSTSTESSGLERKPVTSIKLSLNSQKPKETSHGLGIVKKSITVAQAFNSDSEDEEEEMPPEAKMRMKNVGRDTPTAAGPNSFGKGKLGFSNHHRILEKEILQQMEKEGD